jgi:hypothetical protein
VLASFTNHAADMDGRALRGWPRQRGCDSEAGQDQDVGFSHSRRWIVNASLSVVRRARFQDIRRFRFNQRGRKDCSPLSGHESLPELYKCGVATFKERPEGVVRKINHSAWCLCTADWEP